MTKQQKKEIQLQKQIRKLERTNFLLEKEITELRSVIRSLNFENRRLNSEQNILHKNLNEATDKLVEFKVKDK